jgi:hypothetical protein
VHNGGAYATGRPKAELVLRPERREQPERLAGSRSLWPGLVSRAKLGLGHVEGVTRDDRRHGTTALFADPDTARDQVFTQCRRQEYLGS